MKQARNNKFDIMVSIPTYNEADSIANTIRKIDEGLIKYFPTHRSLIVNVDSKSVDGTRRVFLSTTTKTAKISFASGKRLRGKGVNIFLLLKLSKKFGAKYIATIDADITTITEKWPKLLLTPIIRGKADFVAPVYTRNRYEGNTTNHFCFPLLYAWFGRSFNQPIGGDFAMSSRFASYVLSQEKPQSSYLYGIDIFLSTHAIGANFKTEEVFLGRKIHKSSFDKIIPMFQQVATTMIFVLSQYKSRRDIFKTETVLKSKQRIDTFIRKPDQTKIVSLRKYALQNLRKLPPGNIHKYLGLSIEKIESILGTRTLISEDEWVKILASLSDYIVKHLIGNKDAAKIATTLSPFFFLRVLEYFKEIDKNRRQKSVDALILNQAKKLRSSLVISSGSIDISKKNSYSTSQQSTFKTKQKGDMKMKKIRINPEAWKYWYPTKEETVDEDMPLLGKEFRENNVSKILDLGCGTGRHAIYFAQREFEVYGFDFSRVAIKQAKEKAKKKGLQVNLRVWDCRKTFPYPDEFFDAVIVVRVIHHYSTEVIGQIIKEIERILKVDGYLYIQVPTLARVSRYARLAEKEGNPQIRLEKGTYVPSVGPEKSVPHHGFTKEELKEFFGGLKIRSIVLKDGHYNLLGTKK